MHSTEDRGNEGQTPWMILPEDGCSYDLVVTELYGRDRVWAVPFRNTALSFRTTLMALKASLRILRMWFQS